MERWKKVKKREKEEVGAKERWRKGRKEGG